MFFVFANINKTKALRNNETKLFTTMLGPMNLYLRTRFLGRLRTGGIDTKMFTAHNTVSKANEKDVLVHEIIAKTGWKSAQTFREYYNKPAI